MALVKWVRSSSSMTNGDIIYVMPPFVIDLDDLTHLTNAMVKVIGEWSTLQGVNVGP